MPTSRRGAFIVIEGLDRSGKSTQAAKLISWLSCTNANVELIKFPGQCVSGSYQAQPLLTPLSRYAAALLRNRDPGSWDSPHHADRHDDRRVPALAVRPRRPRRPPPLLREPVGARVSHPTPSSRPAAHDPSRLTLPHSAPGSARCSRRGRPSSATATPSPASPSPPPRACPTRGAARRTRAFLRPTSRSSSTSRLRSRARGAGTVRSGTRRRNCSVRCERCSRALGARWPRTGTRRRGWGSMRGGALMRWRSR